MAIATIDTFNDETQDGRVKRVRAFGVFVGFVMVLIGVRFAMVPESASFTFGVAFPANNYELHDIIAARDVWVGFMVLAFALFQEWRSLSIWFLGAAFVCMYDATIVNASTANDWAIAFHLSSGVLCLALARGAHILHTTKA